ncbi:MAG TPA: hypothetical protein VN742_08565 [Candidatus Binataceae bacterium]|nr:hypothetical protein [Candidatus Binataceae bacterium]
MKIPEVAAAVGAVLTAVGLVLGVVTLRHTHDWNRRHYTIEFISGWNEHARDHLAALEQAFPEFRAVPDFIQDPAAQSKWLLQTEWAERLIKSNENPDAPKDLELRRHLIALLNYFEAVATAYEQYVVDRPAVEDSFAPIITDVVTYFQPFINLLRARTKRDPWPPLSRVALVWVTEAGRIRAQRRSIIAEKQHEDAQREAEDARRKAQQNLKAPTGS